jgi:hypothetical protein
MLTIMKLFQRSKMADQSQPVAPSEFAKVRNQISKSFQEWAALNSAKRRPLPDQTGDGTYLEPDSPDLLEKLKADLKDFSYLGVSDFATLVQVLEKTKTGDDWDDSKYLMEKLIHTATKFPDHSAVGKKVTDGFLTQLYNDLQHPPISYLGDHYKYRSADGSYNVRTNLKDMRYVAKFNRASSILILGKPIPRMLELVHPSKCNPELSQIPV